MISPSFPRMFWFQHQNEMSQNSISFLLYLFMSIYQSYFANYSLSFRDSNFKAWYFYLNFIDILHQFSNFMLKSLVFLLRSFFLPRLTQLKIGKDYNQSTHWGLNKMTDLSGQHFQMHFLGKNFFLFKFHWILFIRVLLVSTGSVWCQAII